MPQVRGFLFLGWFLFRLVLSCLVFWGMWEVKGRGGRGGGEEGVGGEERVCDGCLRDGAMVLYAVMMMMMMQDQFLRVSISYLWFFGTGLGLQARFLTCDLGASGAQGVGRGGGGGFKKGEMEGFS